MDAHILETSLSIANSAFCGLLDKSGKPMVVHSLRVMSALWDGSEKDDELQVIGLFHDLIEDTNWTLDDLKWEGYSDRVITAVDLLTRKPTQTYNDYVQAILDSGNRDAILVKLADARDNYHRCVADDTSEMRSLARRYFGTVGKIDAWLCAQAVKTGEF